MDLKYKKILFIGPIFHDYHKTIINKLIDRQCEVTFFPERRYNLKFKILNNFRQSSLIKYQNRHYAKILDKIEGQHFDYLLVIRGYMMSSSFIESIRKQFPDIKIIMYQWDSDLTNPFSHLIPYIDKVFTFDYRDFSSLKGTDYLPLFYSNEILSIRNHSHSEYEYDFFLLGWYLPERYDALIAFKKFAKENNYRVKSYIYIPFTSYIKEIAKGVKLDKSVIYFKPLKRKKYLEILSKSRAIVDVSNKNQTGLAIRIIEAIGAGAKIVTNNYRVKNELLYSEENFTIINTEEPYVSPSFMQSNLRSEDNNDLLNCYSIDSWIDCLFNSGERIKYLINEEYD